MATKVLDLDVEKLPELIDGLDRYHFVWLLYRYRGRPLGQVWLPVRGGQIDQVSLYTAIAKSEDGQLVKSIVQDYLGLAQPAPPSQAPLQPALSASVAICTRDRPEDLKRCLDSLMALPDDGQEYLVIDNAPSSNATQQVVSRYGSRVRYIHEPRKGLNVARNRALTEAHHEIVAFIDDDAVAEPNWLRALLRNFEEAQVACVTGLTAPLELETEAQEWFERYTSFSRGFRRRVFDRAHFNPFAGGQCGAGVNMALRRSSITLVGPFDEALDGGTPSLSGGDTEMFIRLLTFGYRIVYEPAAVNWHRHRRTWSVLRRTVFGYGVGSYAAWTSSCLTSFCPGVLVVAGAWLFYYQLPTLLRALLVIPGSPPLSLILAELCGCLWGPWAYLQARRKLYRVVSSSPLPQLADDL